MEEEKDYEKFMKILDNQVIQGGSSPQPYTATAHVAYVYVDKYHNIFVKVDLTNLQCGFCFDAETGKLAFAYNYQE